MSQAENDSLLLAFSEEEINTASRLMKSDMTPGPDGWPLAMFKEFWPMFKDIIFAICNGFLRGPWILLA